MTSALMQLTVNGGGPQTGGVPLASASAQTIHLAGINTTGWKTAIWEIYSYPVGFNPGGSWTLGADGYTWTQSTTGSPSNFVIAGWGKYLLRVRVNGNPLSKNADGSPNAFFSSSLTDETTSLDVLSPSGLHDVGYLETQQFSPLGWVGHQQSNLRIFEGGRGFYSVMAPPFNAKGDGVTDDSAAFQAAVTALAGTGYSLFIPGKTFVIKTTIVVPSNVTIVGTPGAVIVGNLVGGGSGSTNATFLATWSTNGVTAQLNAAPVVGSDTIVIKSLAGGTFSNGQDFSLQSAAHIFQVGFYTIKNITGPGPTYTITLDRPIMFTFSTNDPVVGLGTSVPKNIHLLGNGLKFTGSPNRHCEFAGTYKCSIEGCLADTSLGATVNNDYWFSFDVGGRENTFRDMGIDMYGATAAAGLALESQERSLIENCKIRGATSDGILVLDSVQCEISMSSAWFCSNGIHVSGEDGAVGTSDLRVFGGSFYGNSSVGIFFDSGSHDNTVTGADCSRNTSIGIIANGAGTGGTPRNKYIGCKTDWNGSYGIQVPVGATDTQISAHSASNNGVNGILCTDDTVIDGFVANNTGVPAGAGQTSETPLGVNGGTVSCENFKFTDTQASTNLVIAHSAGTLSLDGGYIRVATNNYGWVLSGTAVGKVANTVVVPFTSATATHGLYCNAAGVTLDVGPGVDATATATPLTIAAGTMTHAQKGAVTKVTASGTTTLTHVQAAAQCIEASTQASGTVTITAALLIPGMQWLCKNNNTGSSTTTFFGVTIAIAHVALVRINSAGSGERAEVDT